MKQFKQTTMRDLNGYEFLQIQQSLDIMSEVFALILS